MRKSEVVARPVGRARTWAGVRLGQVGRDSLGLAALALLIGLAAQAAILYSTGGQIAAPLDDTYIHLRYAVQTADGQLFAYNTEDGYSSGATSFLYVLVLAVFAKLGARGDTLLAVAHGFNTLLFAASGVIYYLIGRRMRGRGVGLVAAGFVLLNGRLLWGFNSGMEIALIVTLLGATLLAIHVAFWPDRGADGPAPAPANSRRQHQVLILLALVGAGLALVRPEGLFLVWAAAAWAVLRWLRTRRNGPATVALGVAAVLGLTQLALNWYFTGRVAPNTGIAKSIYYALYPIMPPLEVLRTLFAGFANRVIELFAFSLGNPTAPPLGAFFAALALFPGVWREIRRRVPGFSSLGAIFLFGGLLATCQLPQINYGRYQMPIYALLALFAAVGMYDLARWLAHTGLATAAATRMRAARRRTSIFAALSILSLMLLASSLQAFWAFLGENSIEIYEQQVTIGRWIRDNLPPGTRIAVNDVGAMAYYGERYVYDLMGLTTNQIAGTRVQGDGVTYEWLETLPADRRPDYFVVYDAWFPPLTAMTHFLPEANRWHLLKGRVTGGTDVSLHTVNWGDVGGADTPWLRQDRDPIEVPAEALVVPPAPPGRQDSQFTAGHLVMPQAGPLNLYVSQAPNGANTISRLTLTAARNGQYTRLEARDAAILSGTTVLRQPWATANLVDGQWALVAGRLDSRGDEVVPPLVFSTTLAADTYQVEFTGIAGGIFTPTISLAPPGSAPPPPGGAQLLQPTLSPPVARTLVDRVDVADLLSEGAHKYRIWAAQWNDYPISNVQQLEYVERPGELLMDGGRQTTGGEEFTVATTAGKALKIVHRYQQNTASRLQVEVNGVTLPPWTQPPSVGNWAESAYVIPATAITGPSTHLRFTVLADGANSIMTSYYWWLYQ